MRRKAGTQKSHTSKNFLREHTIRVLGTFLGCFDFYMMQGVLIVLTRRLNQKSKLVLVARLLFVSPYNN
jgi:hypothetical protein